MIGRVMKLILRNRFRAVSADDQLSSDTRTNWEIYRLLRLTFGMCVDKTASMQFHNKVADLVLDKYFAPNQPKVNKKARGDVLDVLKSATIFGKECKRGEGSPAYNQKATSFTKCLFSFLQIGKPAEEDVYGNLVSKAVNIADCGKWYVFDFLHPYSPTHMCVVHLRV